MKGAPYHRGVCLRLRPGIEPGPSALKAGTRPIKVTRLQQYPLIQIWLIYELLPALCVCRTRSNRRVLGARQQEVSAGLNFAQMCLNK